MAVATDKTRVSTYIEQKLKDDAEKVAKNQGRSLSNYIEQLIKQDVARAKQQGEISD
ncbi:hypothetical protein [Anabaena azotica]|uniref:hypothetical protein n=1 Tax=Anabaena azotica TaxID=197653 RepID=UPI0039A482F4